MVFLIKPQFEAGPERVGKGGVVRDPGVHRDVLRQIVLGAAPGAGLHPAGLAPSPIKGPAGNREYLMWAVRMGVPSERPEIDEAEIDRVVWRAFGG
ncbi:hypothetical protein HQ520_16245 [bacterium]|nr:hypothetical protein [bacterium]